LVINVLQLFVFDAWNIPFWVNVLIFIVLIILYTLKGGIRTIVWTDTLQTTFMLLAVVLSVVYISRELGSPVMKLVGSVWNSPVSSMIVTDWHSERFFLKQFLSGMFITISMTGLDQRNNCTGEFSVPCPRRFPYVVCAEQECDRCNE